MSHKYNLRSRESTPSNKISNEESVQQTISSSSSSATPTSIDISDPTPRSPYFTGFLPSFQPIYIMSEQGGADQINVVDGSQDNLNVVDDEFQDAQNLLAGNMFTNRDS